MTAAACYDRPISQDTIRRPSPSKPPLPILVRASKPGEQRLVPLSLAEHSDRSAPLDHVTATVATLHYIAPDSNLQDIALSWEQPVDPIAFTESLAKALSLFPCCAGRFVTREVSVEQAAGVTLKERRTCILCNNAGITFTHGHHNGKRPSVIGPMTGLFGRAAGTTTKADGCGGPLLRAGLHETDSGFPKLDPSFTYLHRRELTTRESSAATAAAAAAERLGVATFLLKWEELNGLADSFSQQLRGPQTDTRLLKSKCFHDLNIVESLGRAVCASVWLDYGLTFGYDRLFGHVRGVADVDLPAEALEAAAVMKRKLQIARGSTDFWRWKAQQTKSCPVETLDCKQQLHCSYCASTDVCQFKALRCRSKANRRDHFQLVVRGC
eukprot:g32052.t2